MYFVGSYGYGGTESHYQDGYHDEYADDAGDYSFYKKAKTRNRQSKANKAALGNCATKYLTVSLPFSCTQRISGIEPIRRKNGVDNDSPECGENNNGTGISKRLFLKIARLFTLKGLFCF